MDIEMYADKALMSPENLYDYHSLMIDSGGGEHHRFPMNEMGFQCSVASHESASVNFQNQGDGAGEEEDDEDIKAKIASHPSYSKLLDAYIDCQKVGAPLEIVSLLDEMRREKEQDAVISICSIGVDPQLDDFMETYYDILVKLKSDLSRPFDEATSFLTDIQTQLLNICNDEVAGSSYSSSSELIEIEDAETKREDRELKERLLRMYGSHISSLRLQFSNKKKKGKLPKEARQTLLAWWNLHSKWPYPTEADKIAMAESTGLDHKQINNWFINQRKRHWKSPIEIENVSANFVAQDEP